MLFRTAPRTLLAAVVGGLVFATGIATPAQAAPRFADVPTSAQFFPEIQWTAQQGISNGWKTNGTSTYKPLTPIARDAMAAFLYRASGSPTFTPPATATFRDVPVGSQFYKEIEWLASKGISTGWDVGGGVREYRPLAPIARDAMAAFLYRLAGKPAYELSRYERFADVPAGAKFHREIHWMMSAGISTGWYDGVKDESTYRPLAPVNRDAMAAFLYRFDAGQAPLAASKGSLSVRFAGQVVPATSDAPLRQCGAQEVTRNAGLAKATAWRLVDDAIVRTPQAEDAYFGRAAIVFPDEATAKQYLESVRDNSRACAAGAGRVGASGSLTNAGWDEAVTTFTATPGDELGSWGSESVVARRGRSVVHARNLEAGNLLPTAAAPTTVAEVVNVLGQMPR